MSPAFSQTANVPAAGTKATPARPLEAAPENPVPQQRGANRVPQSEATRPSDDDTTAASKTTITSDALQSSNAQNTYDAIRNVPGVVQTDARGGAGADSLQIRGIKLSNTTSYRLDGGLPLANTIFLPIEDKLRVEALKGAGALQFGVASPAGIINYVMKRATVAPINTIYTGFNNFGQMTAGVDVGRRFGPDNQAGVRVNLTGGEVGSYIRGAGGSRFLGSVAADWQPIQRVKLLFDYERFDLSQVDQGTILLNPAVRGRITLPPVPDPTKLRSGRWARNDGYGENIFGRANVDVGAGFEVIGEVGRSYGIRPEREVSQINNYNIVTGLGRQNVTLIRDQKTLNKYIDGELRHRAELGPVRNLAVAGITRNERDFNNPQNPIIQYTQNIYEPFDNPKPVNPTSRLFLPNNSHDVDYFVRDEIDVYDRFHFFVGLRRIEYQSENYPRSPLIVSRSSTRFDAPGFGAVIDITPKVSVYASLVKSLEETGSAPASAANAYTVLPPSPARQKEIGVRLTDLSSITSSLGYFNITRANATVDPFSNIYSLNGSINYEGVESTLQVALPYRVTFNATAQYMHATQTSLDAAINTKAPENTPLWSGSTGVVWRPELVPGLTLGSAVQFIGGRQVNPQNQAKLPGVALLSANLSYVRPIMGYRTSFNLSAQNLLDQRYYSAVTSNLLGIGAPRTVALSARVDF